MSHRIGPATGVALYVGAVLGPGVLALPALAARTAGPASILSWLALLALSVPVAVAFGALGSRYPDGGGIASFVSRAYGGSAAAAVGWWFYFAVPIGTLAGARVGAEYLTAAGVGSTWLDTALILGAAVLANLAGLRISGAAQLALVGLLVALMIAAILTAAPHARAANFTPFAPHGPGSVLAATAVLFFGFVGWEAGSHLSAEFRDPRRHLPRVTAATLAVVTTLYVGLAVVTVAVLGPTAGRTRVPLTLLMATGLGGTARPVTAVAAVLLSFGAINTYLASAARLGTALARDRALPRRLAGSPRRSLALLTALTATAYAATPHVPVGTLLTATTACLSAVILAGLLAAVRLLTYRSLTWYGTLLAAPATALVLAATGRLAVLPAILGAAGAASSRIFRRGPQMPTRLREAPVGDRQVTTERRVSAGGLGDSGHRPRV